MTNKKTYKVLTAALPKEVAGSEGPLDATAEDLEDALNHLEAQNYEIEFIQFVENRGFVVCGRAPRMEEMEERPAFSMGELVQSLQKRVPGGSLHAGIHEAVHIWKRELEAGHDINGQVREDDEIIYSALKRAFSRSDAETLSQALKTVDQSISEHECNDPDNCRFTDDLKLVRRQLRKLIRDQLQ